MGKGHSLVLWGFRGQRQYQSDRTQGSSLRNKLLGVEVWAPSEVWPIAEGEWRGWRASKGTGGGAAGSGLGDCSQFPFHPRIWVAFGPLPALAFLIAFGAALPA